MINCILALSIILIVGCIIMPENQALKSIGSIIYIVYIIQALVVLVVIALITAPKELIKELKNINV